MGDIDARLGPRPANLESLFPVWNDASTWNLQPLSPLTSQVFHAVSDTDHHYNIVRNVFAGWVQDDWRDREQSDAQSRRPVRLGQQRARGKAQFMPFLPGNLPHDSNNVAPRMGVNLRLNDRTVLRGGYGLFFAFSPNDAVQQSYSMVHRFEYQIRNNGRPDFVPNWFGPGASGEGEWGGPRPSWDASLARACDINNVPGCAQRALAPGNQLPGPPDALQPSGVGRHPAPDRRHDVGRGELRATRRDASRRPSTMPI